MKAKSVRVPIYGRPNGYVDIPLDTPAAAGATAGVNLYWPDGRVIQASDLQATTPASVSQADKLTTPRTIALGGLLGGSASFDGTSNVTITATMADGALSIAKTSGLQSALNAKAPLASPAFTGTPTGTTAAVGTNTTQLATTAYVLANASSTTPLVDGTAAVGSSTRHARADHVHPTDTSRAPLTQTLNTQNAAYTLVVGDRGEIIQKTDTTARTYTVPASVFAAGDSITIINNAASANITIAQGSGLTLTLAGAGTTGNRTLAPRGMAVVTFVSATECYVTGAGLT